MEVVVVGGGIVGLASAYFLGERGADVTVFEQGSLGHGSTERSAGGIRRQFSTRVNVALSQASRPFWEGFEDRFGVDIAYRRPGYLFLAREAETAEALARTVTMQHELGVPTERLEPSAAKRVCPELHAERFRLATYLSTDGFVDPHLALQGLSGALPSVGADLRTHAEVTDVLVDAGRVTGVVVDGDRVETDAVVNAAGPWARRVAAMADVDLPAAPRRRQVLVVDPETPVPESVPLTIDLDTGVYFRPERAGAALVGGHFDAADPDRDPDRVRRRPSLDWSVEALERAADVAGYFGPESGIVRGWTGLYSVTPDHHPIVGEPLPGFVAAVGFSGHGFQHAPAVGQVVAELLLDGAATTVDVSALSSDRFADGGLVDESNVA